jgi:tetratricopeptide (TPR) repeat protein
MKNNMPKQYLFIFFIIITTAVYPESNGVKTDEPAWVSYQKGMYEYTKGEYGKALYYFQQALDRAKVMPEAEMAIGDVYLTQGEYILAEKQYEKAYQNQRVFSIPNQRYTLLYRMAELYERWNKYDKMEAQLLNIVKESETFSSEKYLFFKKKLQESYLTKGINRMVKLYRLEDTFATQAHVKLAVFYYQTGRYDEALENSIFGVLIIISEGIKDLRRWLPDYPESTAYPEFDLQEFLNLGFEYESVEDYLLDMHIFEHLYYLAAISYVEKNLTQAKYIWNVLAQHPKAGYAGEMARSQLKNPRVAPLLPAED